MGIKKTHAHAHAHTHTHTQNTSAAFLPPLPQVLAANIFIIFISSWSKYVRWTQLQVQFTNDGLSTRLAFHVVEIVFGPKNANWLVIRLAEVVRLGL